ncbi:MAG: DUF4258 domain-containing protein [Nitrospirota bacterium]
MNRLVFRVHAIKRMFQRHISEIDVKDALENGETIETYQNDKPYPSKLVLGWCGKRPLHVVVAENSENQETITVYEPDPQEWEDGLRRRRR